MKRIFTMAVMLGLAAPVISTEYYVEKGGNNDNPGTRMQPFKTIQKAVEFMQPGDSCTVSRGLYRECLRPARSGKAGAPILIQAASNETVTLAGVDEGTGWQPSTNQTYRIKAETVLQVLVDEIPALSCKTFPQLTSGGKPVWFHDVADGFVYIRLPGGKAPDAHNIDIQTRAWGLDASGVNHFELRGFNLKGCGVNLAGSRSCRLVNCHLWWSGDWSKTPLKVFGLTNGLPCTAAVVMGGSENEILDSSIIGNAGIAVAMTSGSENNRLVNSLLRGREPCSVDMPAILVQGIAPVIRNVTVMDYAGGALLCSNVLNARIENNDFHHLGASRTNACMVRLMGDGKGTVLAWNWIHDNVSVRGEGVRFEGDVENYVVRQNVVWGHDGAALKLAGSSRFNYIVNNTCTMNGSGIDAGLEAKHNDFRETRILNNILVAPVWPSCGGQPPAKVIWKNNYTGSAPGFVDETNRNFSLRTGSPCIDAGLEEPEMTDEYTGRLPDMGAYEAGGGFPQPGCRVLESANKVIPPQVKLILESGTDGAEIRYTLDGRNPDQTSLLYTGAVPVIYGAMVKAKAFLSGMEESSTFEVHVRQIE